MSGIISAPPFNAYFPNTLNDSVYQGFVTAIYEVGCLLGAIFILSFGDRLGRRKAVCCPRSPARRRAVLIVCRS
jgi:MFS family permease